jgi:HK97 family phage portal protein
MGLKAWIVNKLNPAQPLIELDEGSKSTDIGYTNYTKAYSEVESIRRGVDLIVNGASSFNISVAEKLNGLTPVVSGIRKTKVDNLLNYQANPYQDILSFKRNVYMDVILEGNAFIYWDGAYLYNLPASSVEIVPDPKTFVKEYIYNGSTKFKPDEIIHIRDNSSDSIYRGMPRLKATNATLVSRAKMVKFQDKFFDNGAVPGLVLKTPNVLGDKVKQRLIASWQQEYSPTKGGRRPAILDGGLEIDRIADINFKELDFETSITNKDKAILLALGVPDILVNGGNNANITPNLRLFYLETVLPTVRSLSTAFERYFGYNLEPEASKVSALQPDLRDIATYHTSLVNGGVLTPNEARLELRYEKLEGLDEIRVPANIAGSAVDPSQGGRPENNA